MQTKDWSILEQLIESWQATAETLADSALSGMLTAPTEADEVEDWEHVESELFDPIA